MAAHISRIVEKLVFAIRAVNEIIVRSEAASSVHKKEVLRDLCTALRRVVNHDALWQALDESARGASSIADIPDTEKFLESFSDILGDAHA